MDRRFLADGVHMAVCDEDLVVLDARTDRYACLPLAATVLRLVQGTLLGPADVLADLDASGLVRDRPGAPRTPLPPPAVAALSRGGEPRRLGDDLLVLQAMAAAWRRGPGRRPLERLLADGEGLRVRASARDPVRIAAVTAAFARMLPLDPAQGACLYRAWVLRRALRLAGQDATWVFGVRTWPFSAHCWLQADDRVLDDDPDRTGLYTPIMAV